jgi:hypothetical protein
VSFIVIGTKPFSVYGKCDHTPFADQAREMIWDLAGMVQLAEVGNALRSLCWISGHPVTIQPYEVESRFYIHLQSARIEFSPARL